MSKQPKDIGPAMLGVFGTGPFRCTLCGETLPDDMPGPGVCDPCSEKLARQERAERLRPALESIPDRWRWATFNSESVDMMLARLHRISCPEEATASAFRLAEKVAAWNQPYVLIAGPSGYGKTSLACAILRYVMDLDGPPSPGCRFVFAPAIAKAFRESRFGDVPEVISLCDRASVLVIDDLGADARYRDILREVIQNREMVGRPTIVTTGLRENAVASAYGDGIARRLFDADSALHLGDT